MQSMRIGYLDNSLCTTGPQRPMRRRKMIMNTLQAIRILEKTQAATLCLKPHMPPGIVFPMPMARTPLSTRLKDLQTIVAHSRTNTMNLPWPLRLFFNPYGETHSSHDGHETRCQTKYWRTITLSKHAGHILKLKGNEQDFHVRSIQIATMTEACIPIDIIPRRTGPVRFMVTAYRDIWIAV